MGTYITDDDLLKIRSDILSLGVSDVDDQIDEAESILNRTLEYQWYRPQATDNGVDWRSSPFNPDLVLTPNQVKRAASYKALETIYLFLMKNVPQDQDAFDKQRKIFRGLYKDEIADVLRAGIDYDWDESGDITAGENIQPGIRRLYRV